MSELPRSLPTALVAAAAEHPEAGVRIFDARGRSSTRLAYTEVQDAARRAAGRLVRLGVRPGDRVAVALPTSFAWLDAWLGALHLGALPVAVAPGAGMGAGDAAANKLRGVADRVEAALVVATPGLVERLVGDGFRAIGTTGGDPLALTPEELADVTLAVTPVPPAEPEDPTTTPAFLQLTSGSTGHPRAVQITHRGVLHNALAIDRAIGDPFSPPYDGGAHRAVERQVSWAPLHHDMGLVGTLHLMLTGIELALFPPAAFLARPRTWLSELSAGGRAMSAAPNFAFQLAVERVDEATAAGLDLSAWKVATVSAEMVRRDTLAAFAERFAPAGFDPRAFRPAYGLAEATVLVTMDRRGEGPRTLPLPAGGDAVGTGLAEVVSCGPPVADTEVRIATPNGAATPPGTVGGVEVRGPGVFAGYHRDPEATAASFTEDPDGGGRWLRTGDLGFLAGGELYVTGRSKDVLIVRGQNLMPHELEWIAEGVTGGGSAGRAGAFTVARGPAGEEVVLAVEMAERDPEAATGTGEEIRSRIGRQLGLPVADLVLLRRGGIPKTTSGKVQRGELRRLYLAGELERLG